MMHGYAPPARFLPYLSWTEISALPDRENTVIVLPAGILTAIGMYQAFFVVPADYQQGESFRILYLHVPAAWMSLLAYMIMAICAFIALVWRIRVVEILAMCSAPVGAAFTV